tara:strand:- start:31545 stop:31922 length:378 start_codon:yes stop_codon:yes gene_type:complete
MILTYNQKLKVLSLILYGIAPIAILYCIKSPELRFFTISILAILGIYLYDKKNYQYYIWIMLFLPLCEAFVVTYCTDTWAYKSPSKIGVPIWLFPLWGCILVNYLGVYNLVKDNDFFTALLNLHK